MAKRVEFLCLSQEDVVAAGGLDMTATVADVEEVFRLRAAGDYVLPDKVVLHWGEPEPEDKEDHINTMPAYIGGRFNVAGLKTVASFPRNPFERGMPRASALIVLNDPEVGFPLAVMDGTLISAMRTGAVTGVATKYLAGPDVTRVGLIGAGVQNRTQLMAVQVVRPAIRQALVFDIRRDRAEAFAAEMSGRLNLDVRVADSAEDVVRQAEVLVTATTTIRPIVHDGWLSPGSFYSHVSGYECEYDVIRHADKVLVDAWHQVKHRMCQTIAYMWRDGQFSDEDVYAELEQVVSGQKPGREHDGEVIFFNPVGMGIQDIAVGYRIYRTALEKGIGRRQPLWVEPLWV